MRVLVTGASGVVGQAIVPLLRKAKNIDVIAIEGHGDLDLECFSDTRAVFRFTKPDHVIHLAGAVFGVGGNLKFPADSFKRNIMINCNVIECCRECSVKKIVAMGTTAIYSDEAAMPFIETDDHKMFHKKYGFPAGGKGYWPVWIHFKLQRHRNSNFSPCRAPQKLCSRVVWQPASPVG